MKTKKCLTANLKEGMVVAEGAYTHNHLVIQSNTVLTKDIIDKLKYYAVKSVVIYLPEEGEAPAQAASNPDMTYTERLQNSSEFKVFKESFENCVDDLKHTLTEIITKNADSLVNKMLQSVDVILTSSRNPSHLLEMMQCMRSYDDMTYTHSVNVALICNIIGTWLRFPADEMDILTTAGLLHDIGKLRVPADIIKKPGKLTDAEFDQIRMHPEYGYEILKPKTLDKRVKLAALQHHERFDGSGYPKALAGSDIETIASIVAIADVYDAMTADRVYRKGICPFPVVELMERERHLYNPTILYTFIERTMEAYVNTEVILNTDEKAKVVLLNKNFFSRPVVITDAKKTYDLSKESEIQIVALV